MTQGITQYLDDKGILINWPAKYTKKVEVIYYLSSKFVKGEIYDEQDVNLVLKKWSDFSDYVMLRRFLVDLGLLKRDRYGKRYELTNKMPNK